MTEQERAEWILLNLKLMVTCECVCACVSITAFLKAASHFVFSNVRGEKFSFSKVFLMIA